LPRASFANLIIVFVVIQLTTVLASLSGAALTTGVHMLVQKEFGFIDKQTLRWGVTVGFKSDGASIPRALWSLVGSPFTGLRRDDCQWSRHDPSEGDVLRRLSVWSKVVANPGANVSPLL
jgi:hypothetical protein